MWKYHHAIWEPSSVGKQDRCMSLLRWVLANRCFFLFLSNSLEAIAFNKMFFMVFPNARKYLGWEFRDQECHLYFKKYLCVFWTAACPISSWRIDGRNSTRACCRWRFHSLRRPRGIFVGMQACTEMREQLLWLNSSYLRCTRISLHDLLQTLSTIKRIYLDFFQEATIWVLSTLPSLTSLEPSHASPIFGIF
jgi:hypothetical protein